MTTVGITIHLFLTVFFAAFSLISPPCLAVSGRCVSLRRANRWIEVHIELRK